MTRLIIIFISLTLALAWGIGFVWPKYQDLVRLEKINEVKIAELQRKEEYLQELKKTSQELKNYQSQLAKIDLALPADPSLAATFDFIQKVSSQSGLVLTDIKPPVSQVITKEEETTQPLLEIEKITELEELKETKLSFLVVGDYSSFKNFLSVLEKSARLFEIEAISFLIPEKEDPWKFDLKIKVYSY